MTPATDSTFRYFVGWSEEVARHTETAQRYWREQDLISLLDVLDGIKTDCEKIAARVGEVMAELDAKGGAA